MEFKKNINRLISKLKLKTRGDDEAFVRSDVRQSTPLRPNRTFEEFFRHLKQLGFDPEVCVDVGAADGTGVIYEAFPNAFHLAFEPLPEFVGKLRKRLDRFNHKIYECALMEVDGVLDILRTDKNVYGSSLMFRGESDDPRLIQVPVKKLDDVMANHPFDGQCLLKTDCQGADLLVVKGGLNTLDKCDVVILETSFFKFWGDHHPDFYEIIDYMNSQNFVVYDVLDGCFRPSDNALGQVDLVFVKRDGFLRSSNLW